MASPSKWQNHNHAVTQTFLFFDGFFLFPMFMMLMIMGCGNTDQSSHEGKPSDLAVETTSEHSQQPSSQVDAPSGAMGPTFSADPCVLITKSEAEALAGGPMNDPLQDDLPDPAGKGCRYFTTKESNLSRAVEISVWESNNLKQGLYGWPADEHFSRFKAGHKNAGDNFDQLQGLGDDAYFWGSHVHALKGPYVFMVSARGFGSGGADSDAKNKEVTIKAATLAIGKLK